MTAFDYRSATNEERLAEAARRNRNVKAGRAPTDDGIAMRPLVLTPISTATSVIVDLIPMPDIASRRFLWLPWSLLVSDNDKYSPGTRKGPGGHRVGILLHTPRYRKAKKSGREALADQLKGADIFCGRCHLTGVLYEPDRRTRRDPSNYAKLVHDICSKLVYCDDSQLDRSTWERGQPNIDKPGLALTITEVSR